MTMASLLRLGAPMTSFRRHGTVALLVVLAGLAPSWARADQPPRDQAPPSIRVAPPSTPILPPSTSAVPLEMPPPPRRHPGKRLYWDPKFNRMDMPEMIVTGVAASIALATNILPPLKTGWRGGIAVDDHVRSLRASSLDAQLEVRTGTDVGLALMTMYPLLVDSFLVAYWYRGSEDVALQMALIDVEAFAIVGAIEGTSNFFSGRERPYGRDCGAGIPNNTNDCQSDARYRSFFSGHTAVSFTAAALICSHHEALQLFESAADHIACATGLLAAGTIGTLRIVGDAHYFSDVLVGAVVGTSIGLGVPLLHHYRRAPPAEEARSDFHLTLVPGLGGATLSGTF